MASKEDLLAEIRNRANNVGYDELFGLMDAFGFEKEKKTHGYFFFHKELQGSSVAHVGNPQKGDRKRVKKFYVKVCIDSIDLLIERRDNR
jgi:hypothetical protein